QIPRPGAAEIYLGRGRGESFGDNGWEGDVSRITPVQYDSKTWVLAVQGAIDLSNVAEFQDSFNALFDKGIYRIILDLERVTFIASAGFGCLLNSRDVILKNGGSLVFAGTNHRVREIFDLLGITSFLRFAPDLGGALALMEG
ncbi:MAG TPA: STAS domain-containing protein, partial [Nocardioidaceae bacterium]|nr:STAS domain-containing protein [Nocardioidaceae bacterium]